MALKPDLMHVTDNKDKLQHSRKCDPSLLGTTFKRALKNTILTLANFSQQFVGRTLRCDFGHITNFKLLSNNILIN